MVFEDRRAGVEIPRFVKKEVSKRAFRHVGAPKSVVLNSQGRVFAAFAFMLFALFLLVAKGPLVANGELYPAMPPDPAYGGFLTASAPPMDWPGTPPSYENAVGGGGWQLPVRERQSKKSKKFYGLKAQKSLKKSKSYALRMQAKKLLRGKSLDMDQLVGVLKENKAVLDALQSQKAVALSSCSNLTSKSKMAALEKQIYKAGKTKKEAQERITALINAGAFRLSQK